MQEYIFFKKNNKIIALEGNDKEKHSFFTQDGWEKLYEEISASDAESALARLADIRKDEVATEHAFITGSAFSSLLAAILK
ncbi:hypothetical protein [Klebsiella sp. BIGb0407]|uniref:hypothetical protein n=1 Tax=Klebsiella sp. BIGb0407 TaxID=2940603 RepID=UPI00216706CA|nr:hypothetical protein [Klebsiella sp. BIGb0407]MCS3430905.1 hypothetical protein [Klebsiella sp. BIGb0407]